MHLFQLGLYIFFNKDRIFEGKKCFQLTLHESIYVLSNAAQILLNFVITEKITAYI